MMILLAMALLAEDFGAFNVDHTREICRAKVEGAYKDSYATVDACVEDHRADYRRFSLLAARGGKLMAPAFRNCVTEWTADGKIDWGMAGYCAVEVTNGKRDYDMFLAAAPNGKARSAIRACLRHWADEETGLIDWEMVGDCAATGGHPVAAPNALTPEDEDAEPEIVVT